MQILGGDPDNAEDKKRTIPLREVECLAYSFKSIAKIDNLNGLDSLVKLQLDNNQIAKIENIGHLVRSRGAQQFALGAHRACRQFAPDAQQGRVCRQSAVQCSTMPCSFPASYHAAPYRHLALAPSACVPTPSDELDMAGPVLQPHHQD